MSVVVGDLLAFGYGGGGPEDDDGAVVVPHRVRHAAVIAQTYGRINGSSKVTVLEKIFQQYKSVTPSTEQGSQTQMDSEAA